MTRVLYHTVALEFLAENFADLDPVSQEDAPNSVVNIHYAPIYRMLMDLFRALLMKGEHSLRGLKLAKDLLDINPSNYTVWQYRRDCLRRLGELGGGVNFDFEFAYINDFASDNPKNYQIWHHRRAVVEASGIYQNELNFTARVSIV